MYDIDFIKDSYNIRKEIVSRKFKLENINDIEAELEQLRKKKPTIFNIETTNYCNMKCVMCPRTIYMTRKNIWISDEIFEIDITSDISEELILHLPAFPVCGNDCLGICSKCGVNLNKVECSCIEETGLSQWSVLDKLDF